MRAALRSLWASLLWALAPVATSVAGELDKADVRPALVKALAVGGLAGLLSDASFKTAVASGVLTGLFEIVSRLNQGPRP